MVIWEGSGCGRYQFVTDEKKLSTGMRWMVRRLYQNVSKNVYI